MWIEKVTCQYFSHMLKINTNDAIYLDEFFIVIVASVSESDTLYMCHGHVTRNAKSREHTYACIVSPYVCVFVLEKLREHRLHWCHVVPGWLSPRRIASRCYVKNGNEPQTSSSSSFPLRPLCLSLYRPPSRSPLFFVPSFYPYSLSFSYFSSFPLFSILLCIIFLFHDFVLAFRRPWRLLPFLLVSLFVLHSRPSWRPLLHIFFFTLRRQHRINVVGDRLV